MEEPAKSTFHEYYGIDMATNCNGDIFDSQKFAWRNYYLRQITRDSYVYFEHYTENIGENKRGPLSRVTLCAIVQTVLTRLDTTTIERSERNS